MMRFVLLTCLNGDVTPISGEVRRTLGFYYFDARFMKRGLTHLVACF